jgi:hypothetical protein
MRNILNYMTIFFVMTLTVFYPSNISMAAPDPTEVDKIKDQAPLHLVGKVIQDDVHKDLTKEKGHYYQIRKMRIKIVDIKRASITLTRPFVDVYYTYIPDWQGVKYDGYQQTTIVINDVIEVWLKQGELGWEPALGMYTLEHVKSVLNRTEPIPEPYLHFFKRKLISALSNHAPFFVLASLIVLVFVIIFYHNS